MNQITPGVEIRAFAKGADRYQLVLTTEDGRIDLHQEMVLGGQRTEFAVIPCKDADCARRAADRAISMIEAIGYIEITVF